MKIAVIGCGRWGSFIAYYLNSLGHSVSLYGRKNSKRTEEFFRERKNEYLTLPSEITLTTDINCITSANIVVISINSQNLQDFFDEIAHLHVENKVFVLCMKGIEISTGRRLSQIVEDNVSSSNKVAVWLGPGHVQEFCREIPNCMVIDSTDEKVKEMLVDSFSGTLIRFYYGQDLIGNEIGAAAKNVVGIAAGMLDGLGLSTLKGALMSRGTREIARLIKAMGGNELSAYGLCHLGDYEATVFSQFSQNRSFGEEFVNGRHFEKLAEGYFTVVALVSLGKKYDVELPISTAVYEILYMKKDPTETIHKLFTRSLKKEF